LGSAKQLKEQVHTFKNTPFTTSLSAMKSQLSQLIKWIESRTRLTTNLQYSVTLLGLQKFRVLLIYVARSILEWNVLHRAHRCSRKAKDRYANKDALIIAGGPSVNRLHVANVLAAQSSGNLDVFALNWFPLSDLAPTIVPDFFCLSDPITKPGSKSVFKGKRSEEIWHYLESRPTIKLILPHNWMECTKSIKNKVEIWIDDRELVGWSRSISVLKPRGYASVTAHKTIASAVFMGYRNIYLIGLDNSLFKFVEVDEENQIIETPAHSYDDVNSVDIRRQHLYPKGMQSLLYNYSLVFVDLKRCFQAANIFNIDKSSFTDAFPKIESEFID
jgi:hypothetical protein